MMFANEWLKKYVELITLAHLLIAAVRVLLRPEGARAVVRHPGGVPMRNVSHAEPHPQCGRRVLAKSGRRVLVATLCPAMLGQAAAWLREARAIAEEGARCQARVLQGVLHARAHNNSIRFISQQQRVERA